MGICEDNKIDICRQLLHELYHVNISSLDTTENIEDFVSRFQRHTAQTSVSVENLTTLIRDYPDEILYLTDIFSINYIIFHTQKHFFILGPFRSLLLNSKEVQTIFKENRLKDFTVNEFFSYYHSIPTFTEAHGLNMVESILTVCEPSVTPHRVHKITAVPANPMSNEPYEPERKKNIQLIEKRYSFEQRFILDIEHGNARSALMNLHNMQADVKYLKRLGSTLETEKTGAAITRTTVRHAAMNARLPIYLIDRISHRNTLAIAKAKTIDEILQAKETMIREFCSAIQDNHNHKYSAVVQTMLYYFHHNYFSDINLNNICEDLQLSKNHIIAVFKKEMGVTPMAYLKTLRLKEASALLSGTNLSVQEIAESVGIPDANYFIKLFKKEYGVTPHLYKKRFS